MLVGALALCGGHTAVAAKRPGSSPDLGEQAARVATAGASTSHTPDHERPTPEPTPIGLAFGDRASAIIGAAGGTLTSIDRKVTLQVPPGAVTKNTTFTIQSVTNQAPGHAGQGVRIGPEGTTFAVPATITFQYSDDDVLGSAPELLRVGFQDSKGYWRLASHASVDEHTRTASVRTTHLSDWTMVNGVQVSPHRASVRVGESVALTLVTCEGLVDHPDDTPTEAGYTELRFTCTDTYYDPADGHHVSQWSADGIRGGNAVVGVVVPGPVLEHATYVAPARAPHTGPVAVVADYRRQGSGERLLLHSQITVIDPKTDCDELRHADILNAAMTFGYAFDGTGAQGHRYHVDQSASVSAVLNRVYDSNSATWVWRGPVVAGVGLDDWFVSDGVTQSVVGTGDLPGQSFMTVSVRTRDCTYTAALTVMATSITTMEVSGTRLPQDGNTVVGVAFTGMRPVKDGMLGADHLWIDHARDGREAEGIYSPGGFGKTLGAEFTPGQVGTARATWIIGPVRPNFPH